MFSKVAFDFVSFITLVALEWSLNSVHLHVILQISRSSASVDALATLVRLLSCMIRHYVEFQFITYIARILAC